MDKLKQISYRSFMKTFWLSSSSIIFSITIAIFYNPFSRNIIELIAVTLFILTLFSFAIIILKSGFDNHLKLKNILKDTDSINCIKVRTLRNFYTKNGMIKTEGNFLRINIYTKEEEFNLITAYNEDLLDYVSNTHLNTDIKLSEDSIELLHGSPILA